MSPNTPYNPTQACCLPGTGIPLLIASCFKVSLSDTETIISPLLCLQGVTRHKSTVQYATRPDLPKLAYRRVKGKSPGVVFLPGYGSNMNGQKAEALEEFCRSLGHSCLRLVIQNNVKKVCCSCCCNVSGFHT